MIDKGITKAVLQHLQGFNGKQFAMADLRVKGLNPQSCMAAAHRFVVKGLVRKIGPGAYKATTLDVVKAYAKAISKRGRKLRPRKVNGNGAEALGPAPHDATSRVPEMRFYGVVPYGPNGLSLVIDGNKTYIGYLEEVAIVKRKDVVG